MAQCPSCGGILGRDCFNPIECAQISHSMQGYDTHELERQIEVLKKALIDNNIEIPNLEQPKIDYDPNYFDDLPF